ncbi:hypothetical protein GCM10027062_37520 [Nocardioides hungaricus]
MATVTAAEFNQRPSKVKRAAEAGPVVITEHSRPSFVLMTYAEYQRLHNVPQDLAAWLKMENAAPEDEDVEFDRIGSWFAPAEL